MAVDLESGRQRLVGWALPAVRLLLLALVLVLGALEPLPAGGPVWIAGLVAVALVATFVPERPLLPLLFAEVLVVTVAAPRTGGADSPLLPFLAASGLTAGVRLGVRRGLLVAGAAAAVLLAGRLSYGGSSDAGRHFTNAAAQWSVVSLALALASGALFAGAQRAPTVAERYAEAYRLLDQLRAISRRLPGSLDPGTVATILLDHAAAIAPYRRGAVLLAAEGRLVPLALRGTRRLPWRVTDGEPGPVRDALASGRPVVDRREADLAEGGRRRSESTLLAVPVCAESRAVGIVVLEAPDSAAFPPDAVDRIEEVARDSAVPLDTATLFEELRLTAAAEERSRLAHEMHDGVAQDLAHLGYELDAITARLRAGAPDDALDAAQALRRRITEIVGDLRLSITDLRSSIGPSRGLGLALSEYARGAGTASGVTVHVSLREKTVRLPVDVETQLLRIAHEAIGAARRGRSGPDGLRTRPENLWVSLVVDPPAATLVVEDDGPAVLDRGMVEVVRERAEQIGARLDAGPRVPSGTSVRVDVEGGAR